MFGPIIATGVGVISYRLGMKAGELYSQGKNTCEVLPELGNALCDDVKSAYDFCSSTVKNIFS